MEKSLLSDLNVEQVCVDYFNSQTLENQQGKSDLFLFDDNKRKCCGGIICGIDEAGRGPLAGSVFAAGVILPEGAHIEGLNDSKKLSEKKREKLYDEIIQTAVEYHTATAAVEEIEQFNILGASLLAMLRVFELFEITSQLVLIDGNKTPALSSKCEAVVKGDGKSASIAAASILAKVERDRYMREMAKLYPQYCFEKHKGYGTKLHYEKISEYGISPIHRKSFLKNVALK